MMANASPWLAMGLKAELVLFFLVLGVVVHYLVGSAYAGRRGAGGAQDGAVTPG